MLRRLWRPLKKKSTRLRFPLIGRYISVQENTTSMLRIVYRYDLMCLEGLSIALRIFLGLQPIPKYEIAHPSSNVLKVYVKKEVCCHFVSRAL